MRLCSKLGGFWPKVNKKLSLRHGVREETHQLAAQAKKELSRIEIEKRTLRNQEGNLESLKKTLQMKQQQVDQSRQKLQKKSIMLQKDKHEIEL